MQPVWNFLKKCRQMVDERLFVCYNADIAKRMTQAHSAYRLVIVFLHWIL